MGRWGWVGVCKGKDHGKEYFIYKYQKECFISEYQKYAGHKPKNILTNRKKYNFHFQTKI